jgi:hypothetical protein
MINFNFEIKNPWSSRWNIVLTKHGLLKKYKGFEFNVYRSNTIVNFEFNLSTRTDHAGLSLHLGIVGYQIEFSLHDTRHWDYEKKEWCSYD